jgi:predicted enzyme related to lactoylglutathione lyase
MARVVHFEIDADDPARAARFYSDAFGWDVRQWSGGAPDYWLAGTGPEGKPGINGGIQPREVGTANHGFTCTLDVASLDDAIGKVMAAGGVVVRQRHAVPGVGWIAYARDTEGNLFGMMQADPHAK